jgi:hypothetical protein
MEVLGLRQSSRLSLLMAAACQIRSKISSFGRSRHDRLIDLATGRPKNELRGWLLNNSLCVFPIERRTAPWNSRAHSGVHDL